MSNNFRLAYKLNYGEKICIGTTFQIGYTDYFDVNMLISLHEFVDRGFNSLPYRRKPSSKPLGRSISDASQKKTKKPSIFSLFSKRSDPNLSTSSGNNSPNSSKKRIRKPVGRSKSDVGYSPYVNGGSATDRARSQTLDRKRIQRADTVEPISKVKKKAQLSPISENPPDDKKYGFDPNDRKTLRFTKSEEKLPKTSNERNLYSNSAAIDYVAKHGDTSNHFAQPIRHKSEPRSSMAASLSRSTDNLHSSQLPQQKPPLTKGLKVEGIVKRLSMERTTPPPSFTSPAFSYTRSPTERIVYAQVLLDANEAQPKETTTKLKRPLYKNANSIDQTDNAGPFSSESHKAPYENGHFTRDRINSIGENSFEPKRHFEHIPLDYHHGKPSIGHHENRPYAHNPSSNQRHGRRLSSEPPIIPNIRPSYNTDHLADRRRLLESKINGRKFDFNRNTKNEHAIGVGGNNRQDPFPSKRDENTRFSSPIRHMMNQKYYPETRIDDDFCNDIDAIVREEQRQRHKQFLNNELREITNAEKLYGNTVPSDDRMPERQQKAKPEELSYKSSHRSDVGPKIKPDKAKSR